MTTDAIIYTKTARGVMALKNGDADLPRALLPALTCVDGRSTLDELRAAHAGNAGQRLAEDLQQLQKLGFIRVFLSEASSPPAMVASQVQYDNGLDFRSELPPAVHVTEHEAQEGVQLWAAARRGARQLQDQGFLALDAGHAPAARRDGSDLRVLVVEDVASIAQLLQAYLQQRKFTVDIAEDGRIAIGRLDAGQRFDLVLLDVNLPQVNGFDILEYMRAQPNLSDTPVIMVTARVTDADVLRGLKGGADGYIFKPFEWKALYACISTVLQIDV